MTIFAVVLKSFHWCLVNGNADLITFRLLKMYSVCEFFFGGGHREPALDLCVFSPSHALLLITPYILQNYVILPVDY